MVLIESAGDGGTSGTWLVAGGPRTRRSEHKGARMHSPGPTMAGPSLEDDDLMATCGPRLL